MVSVPLNPNIPNGKFTDNEGREFTVIGGPYFRPDNHRVHMGKFWDAAPMVIAPTESEITAMKYQEYQRSLDQTFHPQWSRKQDSSTDY